MFSLAEILQMADVIHRVVFSLFWLYFKTVQFGCFFFVRREMFHHFQQHHTTKTCLQRLLVSVPFSGKNRVIITLFYRVPKWDVIKELNL